MPPGLSIVIVNYNSGDFLTGCFESLERQTYQFFELIVVDNASQDGSLSLAEARPWVKIIRNTSNRGFAAGQNQGFHAGQAPFVMPLNFDIILQPNFLEQALKPMAGFPQVGTISGKLLQMGSNQSQMPVIDNAGLLMTSRRMIQHRGRGEIDRGQYDQRDLVFGAMGAAAIYRRTMLEDVAYQGQFFDESLFTWYEDIDLDWRAHLRGWDCLYVPEAVAYHAGDPHGHSRKPFGVQTTIRNRWMMLLSNECLHCWLRHAPGLAMEELALLRHVLRIGMFKSYLQAVAGLVRRLPGVLRKRRWVRRRALRRCLPDYPQPAPTQKESL